MNTYTITIRTTKPVDKFRVIHELHKALELNANLQEGVAINEMP